ncbi:MAG: 30S ribosomal protein S16 [Verrucomicrobia bacterium GWC2_42_7]|nr:MAG: 30S ribosomal protein S16 [Verrucomicrobia bacterium GWC2_42_7]
MALKIKLQRHGATHAPQYRIVVAEARSRRDGRFVESLGYYRPKTTNPATECNINTERFQYWVSVGAQPTDTVRGVMKKHLKLVAAAKA